MISRPFNSIKARRGIRLRLLLHCWSLLALVSLLLVSTADADNALETSLNVTPKRCVTLRQGQPCFVRARFQWQSSEALRACLFNGEGSEIKCWHIASEGTIVLPQNLPNTTEYILTDSDGVELQRASIVVSWVYRKKRSKRRWRLF